MASSKTATEPTSNSKTTAETNSPATAKAAAATHQAVDAVAVKAAAAEDVVRSAAASSEEALAQKQAEIKQQLHSTYCKTREFAAQNPLATAGIAFAAGVVLTALLRRR